MTSHIISPAIDAVLFSPIGVLIFAGMVGVTVFYFFGVAKAGKFKMAPFKGKALEDIVLERAKKKMSAVGIRKKKVLMLGPKDIAYVITAVLVPPTKVLPLADFLDQQAGRTTKKVGKTTETRDIPECILMKTCKNRLFDRWVLAPVGFHLKYFLVTPQDISFETDRIISLKANRDFDWFGGIYVSNYVGTEYVRYMTDMKVTSDMLEETSNYLKKLTYYELKQSALVERLLMEARIAKERFEETKEHIIGG